ncbi:exodeoxyribonuclease III [Paludibacterium yongneupense]|uniref:exodeoxyribonuclease III n=1 Tax=Paludibacterium yongneupense TaxID=400061 RepID=UPI0004012164|nr:exodeoxyribonuclease III [Paludibacterium yongneupense]
MKLATWNVNSLKVRLPQVVQWLTDNPVDVLCLQELKLDQPAFPVAEIEAAGYQSFWYGQKTYNGVALLVRAGARVEQVECGIPGYDDEQRRVIAATVDGVRIVCAYFVNGEAVDSPKYLYKLKWLSMMQEYVSSQLLRYPAFALLGDFNIAPDDRDVYDPLAWKDKVLCSEPERAAFTRLLALGLSDAFRLFEAEGGQYSWWDYRAAMFRRGLGVRIDHILLSAALRRRAVECTIDKTPRGWERPSDHAPVRVVLGPDNEVA